MSYQSNYQSKRPNRLLTSLLFGVGIYLGMELQSCQTDECKQLLVNNHIDSPGFCEDYQRRQSYLHRVDEIKDPRLAYDQVLRELNMPNIRAIK